MSRNTLLKNAGVLIICLFTSISIAQNSSSNAEKIKAVFIFNFTQFVDWPSSSFSSPEAPFIIGIAGKNLFGSYLEETVMGEKVGTHPIIIKYFDEEKEITNCHILYINYSDDRRIKELLSFIVTHEILSVSDAPNFNKLGGIVRFYTEQNKIRLQINTNAAKTAQLNISSKLLSVAKTK